MLTVTIHKKRGQLTIAERTLECVEVEKRTNQDTDRDGNPWPEGPGVLIYFDREGHHQFYGVDRDEDGQQAIWYDFFVMNEAGQTVQRLML